MKTLSEIKLVAIQARHSLVQDAVGALALLVMLMVGLHIPSFF